VIAAVAVTLLPGPAPSSLTISSRISRAEPNLAAGSRSIARSMIRATSGGAHGARAPSGTGTPFMIAKSIADSTSASNGSAPDTS
jgi:hypothetical protein